MKLLLVVYIVCVASCVCAQERIPTSVQTKQNGESAASPARENANPSPVLAQKVQSKVAIHSLSVFPNPASKELSIKYTVPTGVHGKLILHDMNGKVRATIWDGITSEPTQEIKYDLTKTPPGSYIVGLVCGSDQCSKVVTVVR